MSHLYVTNPFDASSVGKVNLSSESEVDAALAIAEKTHRNNKKGLPKYERVAILKKAALFEKEDFKRYKETEGKKRGVGLGRKK